MVPFNIQLSILKREGLVVGVVAYRTLYAGNHGKVAAVVGSYLRAANKEIVLGWHNLHLALYDLSVEYYSLL